MLFITTVLCHITIGCAQYVDKLYYNEDGTIRMVEQRK